MAVILKSNPISCIIQANQEKGALFLGNFFAASDSKIRKQYEIKAILSICKGFQAIKLPEDVNHLGFDLDDEVS